MVFRALDANARKLTNAAEQLAPGSTSAEIGEIGAIGTAHSEGKVADSQTCRSKCRRAGRREQLGGRKFSWLMECKVESCQHSLSVLLA